MTAHKRIRTAARRVDPGVGHSFRTAALTLIVIVLVVAGTTNLAFATLGENGASVQSDQARMQASE